MLGAIRLEHISSHPSIREIKEGRGQYVIYDVHFRSGELEALVTFPATSFWYHSMKQQP